MFFSRFITLFALFCSSLALTGCRYHFGHGDLTKNYQTITVPYIEGDFDGDFTEKLVHQLGTSNGFIHKLSGGELTLLVKLIEYKSNDIGYRYDTEDITGVLEDKLVPAETRIKALAEVSLIENTTEKKIIDSKLVMANIDFDHDYYSNIGGLNSFSLGQVNDIETAEEIAKRSLNKILAEKIVDNIVNYW